MRLCARDQFRGVPRFRTDAASMPCSLGEFHPTRPENVSAMRDAIEAGNKTTTVDRTVRSAGRDTENSDRPASNGNDQAQAP